jgi:hypothetical protein
MTRHFGFVAIVAVCLLCASCVVESKNPISDLAAAKQDVELRGLWMATDQQGNKNYLHVGAESEKPFAPGLQVPEEGLMRFWLISHEAKDGKLSKPFGMRFFVSQLGDDRYANLVVDADFDGRSRPTTYWFLKYRLDGDKLETWGMNFQETAKVVESGRLKGEVVRDPQKPSEIKSVTITDTQANIQSFLRESAATVFLEQNKTVYTRIR